MTRSASILLLLLCASCAAVQRAAPRPQAAKEAQRAVASISLAENSEPLTVIQPPVFHLAWKRNWPVDDTNVLTAVIRSPDLCVPLDSWELATLTLQETYQEPETNSSMFFTAYNTNLVTGERSDYAQP